MRARLLLVAALSAPLLVNCRSPKPRAPELVVREASPKKEPAFFNDLKLTRVQRDRVMTVIDRLYLDFAEYDRTRLLLLDATVEQIRAGELNRDELLPLANVTIAEYEKALPRGIAAMQDLHDALSHQQREKLVALFTKGRELTEEERRAARNDKISKVLDLTAGQKTTIYPALLALYVKHWGVIGRFRGALREAEDAFVEDDLKASELAVASDLELMALGEVIFDALEIGMNHLTPDQQKTLAALLDAQLRSVNPTVDNGKTKEKKPGPTPP